MSSKKVTIKDIAAEAGVSITLVSFVMNKNEEYRVSKETAKRIRDVAKRLNYQPNSAARMLRNGKAETIGVIVSDISNKFFADYSRCVEDYANSRGYSVLFGSTDENPDKLKRLIEVFSHKGIDGLVIVPCEKSEGIIMEASKKNIPIVLFDREVPESGLSSVVLDNARAAGDITNELRKAGCEKIEMVSYSMPLSNILERERGYGDYMRKSGLDGYAAIHRVRHNHADKIEEIVRDAYNRGVEGLVFATNNLALNGLRAILKFSGDFGRRMEFVCFDNSEAFEIYKTPVACIRQPVETFGVESIKLLIEEIDGKDMEGDAKTITLNSRIISFR